MRLDSRTNTGAAVLVTGVAPAQSVVSVLIYRGKGATAIDLLALLLTECQMSDRLLFRAATFKQPFGGT
jgi:hypothetical protein